MDKTKHIKHIIIGQTFYSKYEHNKYNTII
jgi:hypothetical protein